MKISCKFGEPSWCSFPLRVLTPKISTRGGSGGVANTKPKYPPDASSGYNSQVVSTFTFGNPGLTMKQGPKVKSEHIRRFPAHDFLYVGSPSQNSRANNKPVISTFKFGYPRLTLKEGPKVKSDHTKRFPAHDFLYLGLPSQTSRTNNKRVISTFKCGYPRLTLKE